MIKHMNVFISPQIGYCHGVVRAIELVKKVALDNPTKQVYVLGRIVHNEDVINELNKLNIITLVDERLTKEELLNSLPKGSILIFTAHGHPKSYEEILKKKQIVYYDAVCPMVLSTHHLINKELKNGHQVIYLGKKNHPEALAALSLSNDVFLIETIEDLKSEQIIDQSPYIINQTTLSMLDLEQLHIELLKYFPKARLANEICNATRLRQESVYTFPNHLKLVYVVGDQKSSNTNSLVKIVRNHLPKAQVKRILNVKEINNDHLKGIKDVGVISGASTPIEKVNEVISYLENFN